MEHSDDELELQDKWYHIEMLRLWDETNPYVKINYCMDEVEQEMESPVCIRLIYLSLYNINVSYFVVEAWSDSDVCHLRCAYLA